MNEVSIEMTQEQEARIKVLASMEKKSIEEYMLSRSLRNLDDEEQAMDELFEIIDARLENARKNGFSKRTFDEIIDEARKEAELQGS